MSATLWTLLTVVGAVGAACCLYGMLVYQGGEKRLRALDPQFQSLDMRFHYSAEQALACMDGVGGEGRKLLRRYWLIDFALIVFLGMVMLAITHNTASIALVRYAMYALVMLRALLDLVENALLLMVLNGDASKRRMGLAGVSGYVTSAKWVCMGLWVAALFVGLLYVAFSL
ncbi:MAG: hypothetical protein RR379_07685 [Clostridia bacterium]